MKHSILPGFKYKIEILNAAGELVGDPEFADNIIPTEGVAFINSLLRGVGTPVAAWYIGLIGSAITLNAATTSANVVAAENAAYSEATREAWTFEYDANNQYLLETDPDFKAEFTFAAAATVRGAFMTSNSTKSNSAGTLLSAVNFSTARSIDAGGILRISAGIELASAT